MRIFGLAAFAATVLLALVAWIFADVLSAREALVDQLDRAVAGEVVTDAERDRAERRLDDKTQQLVVLALAAGGIAAAAAVSLWQVLDRAVLGPLDQLGEQTRLVTGGAFDRAIAPTGPPEIKALAGDIDAMRRRIRSELAVVSEAQEQLAAQAEELARSNADLEQFAYVASHDLQEPLRKVTSFCQLLERRYRGQLDERADQYIDFAVDGAMRMQRLINDLLAFSRVGRTSEGFEPVACDDVLDRALANLDGMVTEAGATLVRRPLPLVAGDPTLLVALFQNLLGNAVKFRGSEPPCIEIGAEADGDEWSFRFADNGIGIDEAHAERVFVIFQRLHSKERYPGTGIGLALCKKIVEFHGGRIWLDAGIGTGVAVRFTLPVAVQGVTP